MFLATLRLFFSAVGEPTGVPRSAGVLFLGATEGGTTSFGRQIGLDFEGVGDELGGFEFPTRLLPRSLPSAHNRPPKKRKRTVAADRKRRI